MESRFSGILRSLTFVLIFSTTVAYADPRAPAYRWGLKVGCILTYGLMAGVVIIPTTLLLTSGSSEKKKPYGEQVEPYFEIFIRTSDDFPKEKYQQYLKEHPSGDLPGFARYLNTRLHGGLEITMRKEGKAPYHLLNGEMFHERGTAVEKAYFLYHVLKVLSVGKMGAPKFVLMMGTQRTENAIRSAVQLDTHVPPDGLFGMVEFNGELYFPALGIYGPYDVMEKEFVRMRENRPVVEK